VAVALLVVAVLGFVVGGAFAVAAPLGWLAVVIIVLALIDE